MTLDNECFVAGNLPQDTNPGSPQIGYIILNKFFLSHKSIISHSVEWKKLTCSEYPLYIFNLNL